jgi:DNA polymerase III subunit gamma/tau
VHGHSMSYQVLARKWRPQAFDAVVGQEAITRTLRNALGADRIAHAYLFAGPRGVGKTTTARLLARALLCPARRGAEPCGACDVCRESQAGAAVDVLEIDGASNRGIDEVRTLRENVKYAPARGRYKVYIIDEVHQLTEAAFNALLKTLEEPPAHVVFVLATTDPRDIPSTVLSRVQRFDFRPIAPEALVASLDRILREEGVAFDAAALPAIARAADGSLRDALSLLDTAIAYGEGRLDAQTVVTLLGMTAPAEVRAFASALLAHDAGAALSAVDRAVRDGEDLHAFTRDVIELLRRALVLRAAPTTQLADLTPTEANELRAMGETVSVDELVYVLRAFLEADALMRESPHPRVELEIAAVRAARRPVPQTLEEVLRRVEEAEALLRQGGGALPGAASAQGSLLSPDPSHESGRGPALAPPRSGPRPGEPRRGGGAPTETARNPDPPTRAMTSPAWSGGGAAGVATSPSDRVADAVPTRSRDGESPAVDRQAAGIAAPAGGDIETAWQRVIEEVMKRKPTLAAILMHARPGALVVGELTIVMTGNPFLRETLDDRANRDVVVQAVRRNVAGADRVVIQAGEDGPGSIIDHPAVQAAIAEFQGEVVAVRPRPPEGEGQ